MKKLGAWSADETGVRHAQAHSAATRFHDSESNANRAFGSGLVSYTRSLEADGGPIDR